MKNNNNNETYAGTEIQIIPSVEKNEPKKKMGRRSKSTDSSRHYVRNADLLPEITKSKELGRITDNLAKMLYQIAENYSYKWCFCNYSFREDMVAHAVMNLMANALKFDETRFNNPFSYYTTAIHNSFLYCLAQEKKSTKIKDEMMLRAGYNPSFGYEVDETHADGGKEFEASAASYFDGGTSNDGEGSKGD